MSREAEWLTRKSRIDARLKQKGWRLVRFTPALNLKALDGTAVEELPTANGPADYALFVKGQLLGIIEAKKVTVKSAKCSGAGKAVRCRRFRCCRRMERITRPVPLREQRNDYLASRYKDEKARFPAA